jgi:four helix bundle protein
MALVEKFEDMLSWKKARLLNKDIYLESNRSEFQKDYALKHQIRKSSISIMSNIAEGFERKSNKEFKYFLNVAKGSASELRSQLYIANDLGYIENKKLDGYISMATEISRLISGFIESLDEAILREQLKQANSNNSNKSNNQN